MNKIYKTKLFLLDSYLGPDPKNGQLNLMEKKDILVYDNPLLPNYRKEVLTNVRIPLAGIGMRKYKYGSDKADVEFYDYLKKGLFPKNIRCFSLFDSTTSKGDGIRLISYINGMEPNDHYGLPKSIIADDLEEYIDLHPNIKEWLEELREWLTLNSNQSMPYPISFRQQEEMKIKKLLKEYKNR